MHSGARTTGQVGVRCRTRQPPDRLTMATYRSRRTTVARALAFAYLAGEWDPPAMGRRGKQCLADRRKWIADLAHVVRAGFPERPADRPGELAEFIASTELFEKAINDWKRPAT